MLCFHYGKFKHGSEFCLVRQKEQKGLLEEQVTKLAQKKKNLERDYESLHHGSWMVAKKIYRKNNGNKAEGGTKSKPSMSPQERNSKDAVKQSSRVYIIIDEGNTPDAKDFVPNTLQKGAMEKVIMTSVSNRNTTASKAKVEINLANHTRTETTPISTHRPLPQKRANVENIGVGINGVARERESLAVDESSHVRIEEYTTSIEMELEIEEKDIMQY
ncbi:Uncharacterized protein TCM_012777 [Theobroma cacao]|uniref:Uncharacterized protein n=1 Tax=Theobroma cacao TaxID=3641 RepID=A0A061FUV9_THECC|nr:Uncharacterized protein TCM_012777 [Theobroma cacao]